MKASSYRLPELGLLGPSDAVNASPCCDNILAFCGFGSQFHGGGCDSVSHANDFGGDEEVFGGAGKEVVDSQIHGAQA